MHVDLERCYSQKILLQWEIKKFLDQPLTPMAGTLDLITNHCFNIERR